jgi:predicted O-methyltransferase YrrM
MAAMRASGNRFEPLRRLRATIAVYAMLRPGRALPPMSGWAVAPETAELLAVLVRRHRPSRVLELGSGASTVILGLALRRAGGGTLVSIDHDAAWAGQTRGWLADHGLGGVRVEVAPLVGDPPWYELPEMKGPFDLLFVDGPPVRTGPRARWPALSRLRSVLAPGAIVVADDADRDRDTIEAWLAETPGLTCEWMAIEKGAAVLRMP